MRVNSNGVVEAVGNIEEFIRATQQAEKSTSDFEKQSDKTGNSVEDLGEKFAIDTVLINEFVQATKRAIAGAVGFGKQAVQSFAHFEQLESALQGLMRDAEKGTELFEHLRAFSFDTTFGVDTLAQASQSLLSVGVAVEQLDDTLLMLGNVASGDTQKFQELVGIFSKIQNTGKASSIQLQQLALRGVPIYQMLKQIGVNGQATSDQITEAFRLMTEEGGQFYNAMERINGTIQGREGFVSDTWREFLTSFAEATGLADSYKAILDVVYEALQKVVDTLAIINGNPVYQAIFRGVMLSAIIGIGGAIASVIIPALATMISNLTVIKMLTTAISATNPFGWVALGIGALTGVSVAVAEVVKQHKAQNEELKETERLLKAVKDAEGNIKSGKGTTTDALVIAQSQIAYYEREIKRLENGNSGSVWELQNANVLVAKYKELLAIEKEREKSIKTIQQIEKDRLSTENEFAQLVKETSQQYLSLTDELNEWWANTNEGQAESLNRKIEELKKLRDSLKYEIVEGQNGQQIMNARSMFSDSEKAKIDAYIEELSRKLNKTVIGVGKTWQEVFKDITSVDVTGLNGTQAIDLYYNLISADNETQKVIDTLTGKKRTEIELKTEERDRLVSQYASLFETSAKLKATGQFAEGELWDKETKELMKVLEERIAKLNEDIESLDETMYTSLGQLGLALAQNGSFGGNVANGALQVVGQTNVGQVANSAMQGFEQGGIWGALISALVTLLSKCESFNDVLEEIDKVLEPIMPLLNAVCGVILRIVKASNTLAQNLSSVFDMFAYFINAILEIVDEFEPVIQTFVEILKFAITLITQVFTVLKPVLYLIKTIVSAIGNLFKPIVEWLQKATATLEQSWKINEEKNKVEEDQLAKLKKVNEQLENFVEAMRAEMEYQLKKQAELFSDRYAKDTGFSVNDMILTPQGKFSTHPDDYIIATKNPKSLGGGTVVNFTVNNTASDVVKVSAQKQEINGETNMILTISKAVARDMAMGVNGWDNAFSMRDKRLGGRALSR